MSCNSRCANRIKPEGLASARTSAGSWRSAAAGVLAMLAMLLATPAVATTETASFKRNNGINAGFDRLGQGQLRFFGLHIYDAQLWASSPVNSGNYAQTPLALTLTYGRNLKGPLIAERSLKEMRGIASVSDMQAQSWLTSMTKLFPNVIEGDQLTGVYVPGEKLTFWLNARELGEVADPQFARLFVGIWLDERSSEPALRSQLLGRK
ncbi:MAG: chalcone isomerase family protein [Burkholderiales bacterium]